MEWFKLLEPVLYIPTHEEVLAYSTNPQNGGSVDLIYLLNTGEIRYISTKIVKSSTPKTLILLSGDIDNYWEKRAIVRGLEYLFKKGFSIYVVIENNTDIFCSFNFKKLSSDDFKNKHFLSDIDRYSRKSKDIVLERFRAQVSMNYSKETTFMIPDAGDFITGKLLEENKATSSKYDFPENKTFRKYKKKIHINRDDDLSVEEFLSTDNALIDLRICSPQKDLGVLERANLTKIKCLTLDDATIPLQKLITIILKATELESLYLNQCYLTLMEPINLERTIQLKDLSIGIHGANQDIIPLSILLKLSPCLENLNLECMNEYTYENKPFYTTELLEQYDLTNTHLPFLESININNTQIDAATLSALLKAAPNLNYLRFKDVENVLDEAPYLTQSTSLKHISFRGLKVTDRFLATLINASTELETIEFQFCECSYSGGASGYEIKPLTSIKKIQIEHSSICFTEVLSTAVLSSTSIEVFEISDDYRVHNIICPPQLIPGSLGNLKKIAIHPGKMTFENYQKLILAAKHLRSLELSDVSFQYSSIIPKNYLQQLRSLWMTYSCVDSLLNVFNIIQSAPNLETIKIDGFLELEDFKALYLGRYREELPKNIRYTKTKDIRYQISGSSTKDSSISHSTVSSQRYSVDANTPSTGDATYKETRSVARIFFSTAASTPHPSINHYRLRVYDQFETLGTAKQNRIGDLIALDYQNSLVEPPETPILTEQDVFSIEHPDRTSHDIFYAKQDVLITQSWQSLPSLSPNEVLTHIHFNQNYNNVEIKYSSEHNLYFFRSISNQILVTMDFLIKIPKKKQDLLPEDLKKIQEFYLGFTNQELDTRKIPENPSTNDFLLAMKQQRVGCCRHRALLAFFELKEKNYNVRYISNNIHAFIEVQIKGNWIVVDLGGRDVVLNIDDSNQPKWSSKIVADYKQDISITNQSLDECKPDDEKKKSLEASNPDDEKRSKAQAIDPCKKDPVNPLISIIQCEKSSLILCHSENMRDCLRDKLLLQSNVMNQPIFYVDNPETLRCTGPHIKRKGNMGFRESGPGGVLYDFIIAAAYNPSPSILLINYDNFYTEDLIRLNSILDKYPSLDNIPFKNIRIVGIINTERDDLYTGKDFYSRFHSIQTSPNVGSGYEKRSQNIEVENKKADTEDYIIDLYQQDNWKNVLLGQWIFRKAPGNNQVYFEYEEGKLKKALDSKKPIHIKNAPWDSEKFLREWRLLCTCGVWHDDQFISIPENTKVTKSEGYDWGRIAKAVEYANTDRNSLLILNPSQLHKYFAHYEVNMDTGNLEYDDGLAKFKKGSTISFFVTHELSPHQWARFIEHCIDNDLKLSITTAPGVRLPDELAQKEVLVHDAMEKCIEDFSVNDIPNNVLIQSTDIDFCVARIKHKEPDWIVIDISDHNSSDLLSKISATADLIFTIEDAALLKLLKDNKKIILKGNFSQELSYALTEFLLKREQNINASGRLLLLPTNPDCFSYIKTQRIDNSSFEMKIDFLKLNTNDFKDKNVKDLTYTELLAHQKCHAIGMENPWEGLRYLPSTINVHALSDDPSKEALSFHEKRKNTVKAVLDVYPYVFISGLTGVGKTRFVQTVFCKEKHALYQGSERIKDWAEGKDSNDEFQILFLDEANLSNRQWLELEGLFDDPPHIIINGTFYNLTSRHKIIFAGNPLSTSYDRCLPAFVERHGASLVFEPLPLAVILEDILKPVLRHSNKEKIELICKEIMQAYQFILELSSEEVLVSPRELQMIALLTMRAINKEKLSVTDSEGANFSDKLLGIESDHRSIIRQYIHYLLAAGIPESNATMFQNTYPALSLQNRNKSKTADFINTTSRKPILNIVEDLIELREWRAREALNLNDAERCGGLGGLILEGPPGVGKSDLIMQVLKSRGYIERSATTEMDDKIFFQIPANLTQFEKKELLLEAFMNGCIVLIDEINTGSSLEELLNSLLSGKTRDGRYPNKPGFLLLGTQNPFFMGGRRLPSTALKRRLIYMDVLPYNLEELSLILSHVIKIEPTKAKDLINNYVNENQSCCLPGLRELLASKEFISECRLNYINKAQQYLEARKCSSWLIQHGFGFLVRFFSALRYYKVDMTLAFLSSMKAGTTYKSQHINFEVSNTIEVMDRNFTELKCTIQDKVRILKQSSQQERPTLQNWKQFKEKFSKNPCPNSSVNSGFSIFTKSNPVKVGQAKTDIAGINIDRQQSNDGLWYKTMNS